MKPYVLAYDFGHSFGKVTNYQRDLVLDTAEAHVQYDYDGVTYSREYFASYPDEVTVMRFSASQPGKLNFTLRPTVPFIRDYLNTEGDGKGKDDRVDLELGGTFDPTLTTDALLEKYKAGEYDPYIEEILFQYGRYLLIASSRKGCLPANLQGIWNYYEAAAWGGGYVNNINVSMNYWPAFSTNLIEMFASYADYNLAYRDEAENRADIYLQRIASPYMEKAGTGENGWAVGSASYPATINALDPTTHSGPGMGAFVSLLLWDYYDFTRDETILREYTYPAVEGMAKFLSKTMQEYDGKWLVYNSASPENANYYRTVGTAFDQQMIYEIIWRPSAPQRFWATPRRTTPFWPRSGGKSTILTPSMWV